VLDADTVVWLVSECKTDKWVTLDMVERKLRRIEPHSTPPSSQEELLEALDEARRAGLIDSFGFAGPTDSPEEARLTARSFRLTDKGRVVVKRNDLPAILD
jgi:hypothetical protein